MLILTRKAGQSIVIGGNIEVRVLGITGGQVRLGIDAPAGTPVDRQEIHVRKQAGIQSKESLAPPEPSSPQPLYANRTEADWRQLLADEAEEQKAWEQRA